MKRYTVSELARETGVAVPSIKFYLREGLLAAGDLSAVGRAYYDDSHVQRLSLVRSLRDVAGLSVTKTAEVLRSVEKRSTPRAEVIASVLDTLGPEPTGRPYKQVQAEVEALLRRHGISFRTRAGALAVLVKALVAIRQFHPQLEVQEALEPYCAPLFAIAKFEVDYNAAALRSGTEAALDRAVVGTVLWEPVILALRRIASEHHARRVLGKR